MNIVIDPGHGGGNRGTSLGDIDEADYTLSIAYKIIKPTIGLNLTRYTDETLFQSARGYKTSRLDADLVLSLHVNWNDDHELCGLSCFVGRVNVDAYRFAEMLISRMPLELMGNAQAIVKCDDVPWKAAARHIIESHKATTVVIELGFASNDADRRALLDSNVQHAMVQSILAAIEAYKESQK